MTKRKTTTKKKPPAKPALVEHQEPPVDTQVPQVERSDKFWPEDRPMPTRYVKSRARLIPCPSCRRLLLDDMGQAVVTTSSGRDVAWLRCRACQHRFSLPVEEV